ncbi:MAG: 2-amino-4-hydroxy-6-hydroxymethyldihydropteridine diphosphokinase [Pseudomonadota bacterium]
MTVHLIALGANLAVSRAANARKIACVARLLTFGAQCVTMSHLYSTPAWPPSSGPDFVNAVLALRLPLTPEAMLARLHRLERWAGRVRGARWGARVLDLDLLASGALVRPTPAGQRAWAALDAQRQAARAPDTLILPHPRLADRGFVLIPLCDVAPDWRHPLTGRTARAMRDALPAQARREIRRLATPL